MNASGSWCTGVDTKWEALDLGFVGSMARPSMANKTSSSRAIRTMAWPSCSRRCGDLIAVLGAINRISSDDDPVSDNLLNQWSDWLEVEPESHLDRLVAHCGLDA